MNFYFTYEVKTKQITTFKNRNCATLASLYTVFRKKHPLIF